MWWRSSSPALRGAVPRLHERELRDISDRKTFFQDMATMKPEGWEPGKRRRHRYGESDGRRIVIKAVNYRGVRNTLLGGFRAPAFPGRRWRRLHTITAGPTDSASLEHPGCESRR